MSVCLSVYTCRYISTIHIMQTKHDREISVPELLPFLINSDDESTLKVCWHDTIWGVLDNPERKYVVRHIDQSFANIFFLFFCSVLLKWAGGCNFLLVFRNEWDLYPCPNGKYLNKSQYLYIKKRVVSEGTLSLTGDQIR